ncbi:MAG: Cro/C1-type DNA-binding domain [Burkholderiales bacterium]|jgi:transcriptional regulator with XRE-family HTH domain|nr:Cro/C1-type DNA-binding domain [Burkholderiales bacterium]
MNNLANNLKYLMKQKQITLIELASLLNIPPEQIIQIKNGKLENPALNTVINISKYFKVSLDKLALGKLN